VKPQSRKGEGIKNLRETNGDISKMRLPRPSYAGRTRNDRERIGDK